MALPTSRPSAFPLSQRGDANTSMAPATPTVARRRAPSSVRTAESTVGGEGAFDGYSNSPLSSRSDSPRLFRKLVARMRLLVSPSIGRIATPTSPLPCTMLPTGSTPSSTGRASIRLPSLPK